MKKLVLTSMAVVLGAVLAHAQGTITISSTVATSDTASNGVVIGTASGTGWTYEVLDMTSTAYGALSGNQQTGAYNLFANESDFSLWADTGVSGIGQSLHAGGINSSGSATAANWAAPTSNSGYNTAASYDYYTVLGWNASLGSWLTVSNDLSAGTLGTLVGNFFGQTAAAYNYAGGAGLSPVDLFGPSGTSLAGSGGLPTTDALNLNEITITPEPTTLALAGLGGISMLFLRRRKA